MYKLIPAETCHLDQIASLTAITGYWDCALKHNNLGLSAHDFMCEYVVKPRLPFTTIAINEVDHTAVVGVIVCGTKQEILSIHDFTQALDPEILKLFGSTLHQSEITNSYHISTIVVPTQHRGQGIGTKLFQFAEEQASRTGHNILSHYTFACQTSSIIFDLKMGMMITNTIHRSNQLPFPILLDLEKSVNLMNKHNYFETDECRKLNLLDNNQR